VADLDDVVLEADALPLLAGAVLDVEDADEVGGPAAHEAVEHLEQHAGDHAHLRERVRQRQQHLRHLRTHRFVSKLQPTRVLATTPINVRRYLPGWRRS
jgi:hypothetical protein